MIASMPPPVRFMYEYGCFMAWWSNFEIYVEIAIAERTGMSDESAHIVLSGMTFGPKSNILEVLLKRSAEVDLSNALLSVKKAANRNSLVHGIVLNPNGDFSDLKLINRKSESRPIGTLKSLSHHAFPNFYEAMSKFQKLSGISKERGNAYLKAAMARTKSGSGSGEQMNDFSNNIQKTSS